MATIFNAFEYLRNRIPKIANSMSIDDDGFVFYFDATKASFPEIPGVDPIPTDKTDFFYFVNGQSIDFDDLSIEQSESIFIVRVTGSYDFAINMEDEVIVWGRFE